MRRRIAVAAAAAAIAVATAGFVLATSSGDGTPPGPAANLWVSTVAGAKPQRCQTPCAYDATHAYGSLAAAYVAASSADQARILGGAYGVQTLATPNPRLSAPVTFEPAPGAAVTLESLTTDVSWLVIRNVKIVAGTDIGRGWFAKGAHHVTLDGVDITGAEASVLLSGGSDLTYRDAAFGTRGNVTKRACLGNGEPMQIDGADRVLVENVDFWPFIAGTGPSCGSDGLMHLETFRLNGDSNGVTLSRDRFHRGDGSGSARIFTSGAGSDDFHIVNTWIGAADGPAGNRGNSVELAAGAGTCTGYVVAYSLWEGGFNDTACPVKPAYYGNEAAQPNYLPCPGSAHAGNLWTWDIAGPACGRWIVDPLAKAFCVPDDCTHAYALAADHFHLTAASPSIDAGERAQCARWTGGVDIDGRHRTGVCDAGPDEHGN